MTEPLKTLPIFPHEDIDLFRGNIRQGSPDMVYELGQFMTFLRLHMQVSGSLDAALCEQAYVAANGTTGADIFSNKYLFTDFVIQLGYTAPRSIVVKPEECENNVRRYEAVAALGGEDSARFCKPLYSTCGRGAYVSESSKDALAFAAKQNEPYLIQTFEFPQRDWRYILHRDVVQLSSGSMSAWRITSQKVRPSVVGDGVKSILQLVSGHEAMPSRSKNGYIKNHRASLKEIPKNAETVELIRAANVAQGAYPQMGTNAEVQNLDRFMAQFVRDVEEALSLKLGTLCVDVGVKDDETLRGDYDYERIKRNLIFYEHQIPFDILYDIPPQTSWSGVDRFLPAQLHAKYIHRKIQWNLMRSVVRSGRYLREQGV